MWGVDIRLEERYKKSERSEANAAVRHDATACPIATEKYKTARDAPLVVKRRGMGYAYRQPSAGSSAGRASPLRMSVGHYFCLIGDCLGIPCHKM